MTAPPIAIGGGTADFYLDEPAGGGSGQIDCDGCVVCGGAGQTDAASGCCVAGFCPGAIVIRVGAGSGAAALGAAALGEAGGGWAASFGLGFGFGLGLVASAVAGGAGPGTAASGSGCSAGAW